MEEQVITIKVGPGIFQMIQDFRKQGTVDWDPTEIWESFIHIETGEELRIIYKLTNKEE